MSFIFCCFALEGLDNIFLYPFCGEYRLSNAIAMVPKIKMPRKEALGRSQGAIWEDRAVEIQVFPYTLSRFNGTG